VNAEHKVVTCLPHIGEYVKVCSVNAEHKVVTCVPHIGKYVLRFPNSELLFSNFFVVLSGKLGALICIIRNLVKLTVADLGGSVLSHSLFRSHSITTRKQDKETKINEKRSVTKMQYTDKPHRNVTLSLQSRT
jgi:hypothetical protein